MLASLAGRPRVPYLEEVAQREGDRLAVGVVDGRLDVDRVLVRRVDVQPVIAGGRGLAAPDPNPTREGLMGGSIDDELDRGVVVDLGVLERIAGNAGGRTLHR